MVEGAALEMLCTKVPRVRIPNSPPNAASAAKKSRRAYRSAAFFSLKGAGADEQKMKWYQKTANCSIYLEAK